MRALLFFTRRDNGSEGGHVLRDEGTRILEGQQLTPGLFALLFRGGFGREGVGEREKGREGETEGVSVCVGV